MISNSNNLEKKLELIKESIVSNYHILSEKDESNQLLKMAIIHQDEILGFTPLFDQTYRKGPILKKYINYLNSLRLETKKYCC